jgi:hypothetical protein
MDMDMDLDLAIFFFGPALFCCLSFFANEGYEGVTKESHGTVLVFGNLFLLFLFSLLLPVLDGCGWGR